MESVTILFYKFFYHLFGRKKDTVVVHLFFSTTLGRKKTKLLSQSCFRFMPQGLFGDFGFLKDQQVHNNPSSSITMEAWGCCFSSRVLLPKLGENKSIFMARVTDTCPDTRWASCKKGYYRVSQPVVSMGSFPFWLWLCVDVCNYLWLSDKRDPFFSASCLQ